MGGRPLQLRISPGEHMEAQGNHTELTQTMTSHLSSIVANEEAGFQGSDLISGSPAASDGRVRLSSPAAISRSRMA